MYFLILLLGFVLGVLFVSWLMVNKLKTHDCTWVNGGVEWVERQTTNAAKKIMPGDING